MANEFIVAPTPRREKLADGCYHVFIDVGSNIGMHARFLLEPSLYPKAWIARKFFVAHFGPEDLRDNRDFCVFGFEPNPSHIKRHGEMRDAYSAMGWRYHYLPVGVGDKNGQLTFYDVADDLGFTAIPKRSCIENGCPQQQVPVYRLSDWIDTEVHGRRIPSQAYGGKGYVSKPRVVMKMDIEMLEWLVMPDLITSGVLCRDIDGAIGEFHLKLQWFLYPVTFPDPGGNGKNWTLHNYTQAEAFMNQMLGMIERNYHCKTQLEMRDDESHAEDGMPWPVALDTIPEIPSSF
ncbi:hypothetical protein ACHAXR_012047 [Thalassiosira sp. AJA248-18]